MATGPGEALYAALGFTVVERVVVTLPGGVEVPFAGMRRAIERHLHNDFSVLSAHVRRHFLPCLSMPKSASRLLALVLAASVVIPAWMSAQVPAELRLAMHARDSAFYSADAARWEQYTAPTYTTVQQDGSFLTRAERLVTLRAQTARPYIPRSREQNTRRGDVVLARFFSGGLWVLEVWTLEQGRWMVLTSQVTTAKP